MPPMRRKKLADFVALYRGRTVSEAELVAVSAEPRLVSQFFTALLGESGWEREAEGPKHATQGLEVVHDE